MWSYRLVAPYTFERVDIPEKTPESLGDRQVLVRFLAAGVCGSDLPGFRGAKGRLPGDVGTSAAEMDGFPIHEVVGEVVASRHRSHGVGDRVVGWASGFDGMMEYVAPTATAWRRTTWRWLRSMRWRCSRWPACYMPSSSFRS